MKSVPVNWTAGHETVYIYIPTMSCWCETLEDQPQRLSGVHAHRERPSDACVKYRWSIRTLPKERIPHNCPRTKSHAALEKVALAFCPLHHITYQPRKSSAHSWDGDPRGFFEVWCFPVSHYPNPHNPLCLERETGGEIERGKADSEIFSRVWAIPLRVLICMGGRLE